MKQPLRAALDARGYDTLTPVQQALSDPAVEGKDLLVSAQTGSGKTLAFGLAMAPTLLGDSDSFDQAASPLALVIAPTRELALQVKRELTWLYAQTGAQLSSCVGGMDMRDERRALARGAHIVVATPGRLRDHVMRGSIDLTQLRAVVLDEADEMLDLGFREDLEFILGETPEDRQTLLLSATVSAPISKLAKNYQRDALRIDTKSEHSQHADIEYRAMMVADRDMENAVINTLRFYEAPNAIVFANTRAMVGRLTTRLSNRGFQVVALSGELSQAERSHALQAMRDGRAQVCVATDVAARGIDLPSLDLVVHAELPSNHETMLHRSGRTGRAGRKGTSALIVTPKSRRKAERILQGAKVKADWTGAPSADEVRARDEDRMFSHAIWTDPLPEGEDSARARLVETFDAERLAAAYLSLYRAQHSAPEELSELGAKPAPRKEFGPSIWFSLDGGRAAGAEPRRLLPMLCTAGDITKDDIGAIRIQQTQSYVQIREGSVPAFLKALGDEMQVEGTSITKLDKPPQLDAKGPPRGPKPGGKPGGKPRGPKPEWDKPRGDKPAYDKPKYDKPKRDFDAPKHDGPKHDAPKHDGPKPRKNNAPTDWNDAPEPRQRKPKPASKMKGGAPKSGPKSSRYAAAKPDPTRGGAVEEIRPGSKPASGGDKPAYRKGAANPSSRPGGKPGGKPFGKGKGKPTGAEPGRAPKVGKPNSKKNKARAAAAAATKGGSKSYKKPSGQQ
ncbi:DEAD/DEAH box helicase [Harenicola maris]|uniref:DEAD/DEAH box helicase n=1 Tax=Harenicola maris TaxID=2841044 RepID=UPI002E16DA64